MLYILTNQHFYIYHMSAFREILYTECLDGAEREGWLVSVNRAQMNLSLSPKIAFFSFYSQEKCGEVGEEEEGSEDKCFGGPAVNSRDAV